MSEDVAPYVVDAPARLAAVALVQCPVAGFKYHLGETCWHRMRADDALTLRREPGNHHDPRAIAIEWKGVMLGYVPHGANYALSQMMDRGEVLAARIGSLQQSDDPWKRVMMEIDWLPGHRRATGDDELEPEVPAPAYVNLGSFVVGAPPSRVTLVRAIQQLDEDAKRIGAIALARCSTDIIARLAMPITGTIGPATRSVRLWDLVEIIVTDDGRGMAMRSLDPKSDGRLSLSADLATPVGKWSWTLPFTSMLDREMQRHSMAPQMLAGVPGNWLERSLRLTFEGFVDFASMRRAILGFLAPDALTRSLANRIFDNAPTAGQFNWCGRHRAALCLAAIEHAPLLPFLRFVELDGKLRDADPMESLATILARIGMEPGAIKRLERWGYEPFADLGEELVGGASMSVLAGFANMLHRLDLAFPPPKFFSQCAGAAAIHFDADADDPIFGSRLPDWFMCAMFREIERLEGEDLEIAFGEEVLESLPWIASIPPEPDSNQRKAGWPWIMERVRHFEIRHAKGEWPVPCEELVIDGYRVIPIGTLAELRKEALEMKNCLHSYAEKCRLGVWAVFSIRTSGFGGGKRVADIAVAKVMKDGRITWQLQQVAGKMNAKVPPAIETVAQAVVIALNA